VVKGHGLQGQGAESGEGGLDADAMYLGPDTKQGEVFQMSPGVIQAQLGPVWRQVKGQV
jgi:hypothetical protein